LGEKYYKIAAIAVITVLILGAAMIILPHPLFSNASAGETEFEITQGESLGAVAHELAGQNLVASRYLFVAYAIFAGKERSFKAGTYKIPSRTSIYKLVSVFSSGKSESEDISVTIPEGTNLADTGKIFSESGISVATGDFLGPDMLKLEGYLFPDTYCFRKPQTPNPKSQTNPNDQSPKPETQIQGIIQKMKDNFEAKTAGLFKGLAQEKIKRVVIIASILEKEVKNQRDMKLVAGIIEKRLSKNMPLGVDAAVAYGVCYPKFLAGQYCDVSMANIVDNLGMESPYNTYRITGLPPAPISNPGLVAIEAALNPQPSEYLYYLSAKDGTIIFSKTAAEHEKAREKYIK